MIANVPVISDETGKLLVEAQKAANVTSREIRTLLAAQNELLAKTTKLEVPAIAEYKDEETTPSVFKAALAGEEFVTAHKEGKPLVLSIYDATQVKQYRIPLSSAQYVEGFMWSFNFESADGNNPIGKKATFGISYIISSGTVTINVNVPQS